MNKFIVLLLLVMLSLASLFIGAGDITAMDILRLEDSKVELLLISRIPRLASIIIAGMGMSIAGLIMQQISRNKFVSPTTAATVDSSRLGILVGMILIPGAGTLWKMSLSFVFAVGGTMVFMRLLDRIKIKNTVFIPLVGIMLGSIIESFTTFLAYRYDLVQNVNSWLQGDFSMIMKGRFELLYISIPLLIVAWKYADRFTVAGMGEDFALNLGLNYKTVVNIGVTIVALISATVIVTVGRIPFLGLIIPNLVTLYRGDNMKGNIWIVALSGSAFLLFADILGRLVIYPYEVSISLTVGVMGSMIFLYLLLRGDR
ncbi:MAG TPA: ABC transporter permease [Tissierellaceae bacterium]|nr:ABC transporter permease [Tissierellaceae bacterium]